MSDERSENTVETLTSDEVDEHPSPDRGPEHGFFRRFLIITGSGIAALLLIATAFYLLGGLDRIVRTQFTAKMNRMGMSFAADDFNVSLFPIRVSIRNARFDDALTGAKILFIKEARLELTARDVLAMQVRKEISIDTADVNGAEVWITFDENGRSNLANLKMVEDDEVIKVMFRSSRLSLRESTVRFGDLKRKLEAQAGEFSFDLDPVDPTVPDDLKTYRAVVSARDSRFSYDGKAVEAIRMDGEGIVGGDGIDVKTLSLEAAEAKVAVSGKTVGWQNPTYEFSIESTADVGRISDVFRIGSLDGSGSFKGKLTGQGEKFRIDGSVLSESLSADGLVLKELNVSAALNGGDGGYEANGKALARMLTYGEFEIDLLQMSGLVRGSGTDMRWLGELSAAAIQTGDGTIGRLYISEAVAEYNERRGYSSRFGPVRFETYLLDDLLIKDIRLGDLVITADGQVTDISTFGARASSLKTDDLSLRDVASGRIQIDNRDGTTSIGTDTLSAGSARIGEFDLRDLRSKNVRITAKEGTTAIRADSLSSAKTAADGVRIGEMTASDLDIEDNQRGLTAFSKTFRIEGIETDAAVLGGMSIGGVRLSIVRGTVEVSAADFEAGDMELKSNSTFAESGRLNAVKVARPVFVLDPAGRYRATADMSLGGGIIGSMNLGGARASLEVTNEYTALTDIEARVMDGTVTGRASVGAKNDTLSSFDLSFEELDVAKLLALRAGRIVPVGGQAKGVLRVETSGTEWRTASGEISIDISESKGGQDANTPITGRISASGANGLFQVETGRIETAASSVSATGNLDLLRNGTDLDVSVESSDASEVERLVRSFELPSLVQETLDDYRIAFAGSFRLNGEMRGLLDDPVVNADFAVASLSVRDQKLGAFSGELVRSPEELEIKDGRLSEPDGGFLTFNFFIPFKEENGTSLVARLTDINVGNTLAAIPANLPRALRDLKADTSGIINLRGLPRKMDGDAHLSARNASIGTESFDSIEAKAKFSGTEIDFENIALSFGAGSAVVKGSYNIDNGGFNFREIRGQAVPIGRLRALSETPEELPTLDGAIDFTGKASSTAAEPTVYDIEFGGTGTGIAVNGVSVGEIKFDGSTKENLLTVNLTANDSKGRQSLKADLNLVDESLPFNVSGELAGASLDAYIAAVRKPGAVPIVGRATGQIVASGNLRRRDSENKLILQPSNLTGSAAFTGFEVQIDQTPLSAVGTVSVKLDDEKLVFERAVFAGGGTNLTITGAKAIRDKVPNNLSLIGFVNLSILNIASTDTFFAGLANVNVKLEGPNETSRLDGSAFLNSASFSTFVSGQRISIENIKGTVVFNANQAKVTNAEGFIGGGSVRMSGDATLNDELEVGSLNMELQGQNVNVPLPRNFSTTGDAFIRVTGKRVNNRLTAFVSGRINARRSSFSTNIDLADLIGQRRDSPLAPSRGAAGYGDIGLDVTIEGRDALVVRNNLGDLTASLSLRVTGNVETPQVSGRITASSGTIFFRYERYDVQRLELVFPPNTNFEPVINLQAESEIKGYQVLVNLTGGLSDINTLQANVRSNPALPQADVISLITTGSLAKSDTGILTSTQTGIGTAADILTDELLGKPISKATDRLFGLNRFELDPILSGQRLSPSARLTVGRQINRNLLVTYSTNLSQDQNQVLAFEYRLSNRLSFVAQYEQRSLANVTQKADSFSFEVKFRKRF